MSSMISKEEVLVLAELARLKISDQEVEELQRDISNILQYVGQVSAVTTQIQPLDIPQLRTIMREDTFSSDSLLVGKREVLLQALPAREGDYALVRKIIHKDE